MNYWEKITKLHEKQEYRRSELRSFIKGYKKQIDTDIGLSIEVKERSLLKVKYMKAYINLLDELYGILYYGNGIRRQVRYNLQKLFNFLDEIPYNQFGKEELELLNWSLESLSTISQQQSIDCYTKLDVQNFTIVARELLKNMDTQQGRI